jgi:hypothetical protein
MNSNGVKKFLVLLAYVGVSTLGVPALAATEGEAEHKSGANLDLFPPPKADLSKSARPAKPELLEPSYRAQISADTATLKWSSVANADGYHLQLATDPAFKWLVVNEELFKGTSYEAKGLEKGKHYFWRVAAMKTDNAPTFMKGWFSLSTFETP